MQMLNENDFQELYVIATSFAINTSIPIAVPTTRTSAKESQPIQFRKAAKSMALSSSRLRQSRSTATFGESTGMRDCNCNYSAFVYSKCSSKGEPECESDTCLSDSETINDINREARSLGWKAHNYTEFYGRKLKEGLELRLGTFEPRVRVKSMSRLSNRLESLPTSFDSMEHWPRLISETRDQGWCG